MKFVSITDLEALRNAQPEGKFVLFIALSENRLLSYLPVAKVLKQNGYFTAIATTFTLSAEDLSYADFDDCLAFTIPNASALRDVDGIDAVVAPEWNFDGPRKAKRIAFYHSLPDEQLEYDYSRAFYRAPYLAKDIDYLIIAVRQRGKYWTPEQYERHTSEIWPAPALADRTSEIGIIPGGYPKIAYLDRLSRLHPITKTIIVSPTSNLMPYSCLGHAVEIVTRLLEHLPDYRIVFRPYPRADQRTYARGLMSPLIVHPRFSIDESTTGIEPMLGAALIITDQSSSAISFSLATGRACIAFRPNGSDNRRTLDPVGAIVSSVDELLLVAERMLQRPDYISRDIFERREEYLYHPEDANQYIADAIRSVIADERRSDFLYIPRKPTGSLSIDQRKSRLEQLIKRARDNPSFSGQVMRSVHELAHYYGAKLSS